MAYSDEKKHAALAMIVTGTPMTQVAELTGISYHTLKNWKRELVTEGETPTREMLLRFSWKAGTEYGGITLNQARALNIATRIFTAGVSEGDGDVDELDRLMGVDSADAD